MHTLALYFSSSETTVNKSSLPGLVTTYVTTFLNVSQMATTTQFGQTARVTKFTKPTNGVAHIAVVTPAIVRMRPVKDSCPPRMKTAIKLFIWANNFLLPAELVTVVAITLTF
ncbi:hypothetical protein V8G54_036449 [Vigna mungo]|uniref:Uncharacterized protein n=1 Tax=Vigna mungo TaxID=3915 RepID=A0AAQ3MHE4_VIGMU